jgi:hypothetical protein
MVYMYSIRYEHAVLLCTMKCIIDRMTDWRERRPNTALDERSSVHHKDATYAGACSSNA